MARKRYIGIDPGVTGALACIEVCDEDPTFLDVEVVDMPTKVVQVGGKNRNRVDAEELRLQVEAWEEDCVRVVIEEVQAIGKTATGQRRDGVVGAFSFGYAAGLTEGVVRSMYIPIFFTRPQQWKRAVGLPYGADKEASRELASTRYPEFASAWSRKKDHGRAEAVLLAHFNRTTKGWT